MCPWPPATCPKRQTPGPPLRPAKGARDARAPKCHPWRPRQGLSRWRRCVPMLLSVAGPRGRRGRMRGHWDRCHLLGKANAPLKAAASPSPRDSHRPSPSPSVHEKHLPWQTGEQHCLPRNRGRSRTVVSSGRGLALTLCGTEQLRHVDASHRHFFLDVRSHDLPVKKAGATELQICTVWEGCGALTAPMDGFQGKTPDSRRCPRTLLQSCRQERLCRVPVFRFPAGSRLPARMPT